MGCISLLGAFREAPDVYPGHSQHTLESPVLLRMGHHLFSFSVVILGILSVCIPVRAEQTQYKIQFGAGPAKPGFTLVTASDAYKDDRGYGFESKGKASDLPDGVTGDKPIYFSVAVPEGNYKVTVTLGDASSATTTTVKAELRRLMLEGIHADAGQTVTRTFAVNVRQPKFGDNKSVRLKAPRESVQEAWAWDNKLTLEFCDSHPCVQSIEITQDNTIPTIFIAGDSTSTDQSGEPFNSWGQMLTRFINDSAAVANHGESGETSSSFIGENRWPKMMTVIKPGDFVLMQFGHNDEKDKGANAGAYKNYAANLTRFVKEARDHGATPIIVTPIARSKFDDNGKAVNTHGDYPDAARKVAADQKCALIDLTAMTQTLYEAVGPAKSKMLFATPNEATHHSDIGSYLDAKCIVEAIRTQNLSLAKYLTSDAPEFDPAHPGSLDDIKIPAEPRNGPTTKPFGS
jgi:lysophospholipase L1-like esterase